MKQFSLFLILLFLFPGIVSLTAQPLFTTWRLYPAGSGNAEKIQQVAPDQFLVFGKNKRHAYASLVDKKGKQLAFKRFQTQIGGIRSEFTDGLSTPNGYLFLGDCDQCVPNDPARKILFVETDKNFNVLKKKTLTPPPPPANDPNRGYRVWGYQRLRQDLDKYVVFTQLIYTDIDDTLKTDIALTKLDKDLNLEFHRAYDFYPQDFQGDFQVLADGYYVMTWSLRAVSLGSDSISLHKFDKNGVRLLERRYPGVGLTLTRLQGDWLIGGAEAQAATFLTQGPQGLVMRVDGESGAVKAKWTFGGTSNKIDGVRDIKPLQNGNLLVVSAEDGGYPDLATLNDFTDVYLYPESFPYPKAARVFRINPNTLLPVNAPNVFPNPNKEDLLLRSIVPLNNDGTQFVACGQFYRKPVFYSVATQNQTNNDGNGNVNDLESEDRAVQGDLHLLMSPNPVHAGGVLTCTIAGLDMNGTTLRAEIFDFSGRRAGVAEPVNGNTVRLTAPTAAGLYLLRITNGQNEVVGSKKIAVTN